MQPGSISGKNTDTTNLQVAVCSPEQFTQIHLGATVVHKDESGLEKLMENCDRLSAEEKAKLLKHLLGDPGFQVIVGSNQVHATTVYQLNLNSPEQIAMVLEAIAKKISSNDSDEENKENK